MEVDLTELERQRKLNFQERLEFIDEYVNWLKKTPNDVWSRQQNTIIDSKKP